MSELRVLLRDVKKLRRWMLFLLERLKVGEAVLRRDLFALMKLLYPV